MIDILFTAWNRLAFTTAAFTSLLENTDWQHVARLVVYDDGSEDGTREWLDGALRASPVPVVFRAERLGSPVAIMQCHINDPDAAPVFAKIDNDVCVPPGWLTATLDVLAQYPFLELLGMEAGMSGVAGRDGILFDGFYGVESASHIGGVGLFRTSAFHCRPAMKPDGRGGFTEWQHTYKPARGWITPDLPIVLLDRLPFEPWIALSREYVENGWQRPWPKWDPRWMEWAYTWFIDTEEAAA